MTRLLDKLGNPERALPPVVHVAGTNGKGSVIAFLRAMLEAAGYRVHVHTSPHLFKFNERIRLAGELITDEALTELLQEVEKANAGDPVTFFEITTAAALLAFSRTPADVTILETGLGGRLDATNVVEKPALTVITPVSLDHQEYLGETLADIAREKAGILKRGVVCVLADQERVPNRIIPDAARKAGAMVFHEGVDWYARTFPDGWGYQEGNWSRRFPNPSLPGGHQVRNAGLAVATLEQLRGFKVPDAAMALGIKSAEWPGRLQNLETGALADALPDGWELWVDGGHNPAAAKALAQQARKWKRKPLHLVFGMMKNRNPVPFLQKLAPRCLSLTAVDFPAFQAESHSAQAVHDAASALNMVHCAQAPSLEDALKDIAAANPNPGRVLVAGSLSLAAHALAANGNGP